LKITFNNLNKENMITQNKRLLGIVLSVVLILLVPLIAMQFTNEVNWELPDFVVAAALLLGTGLILEFVMRKVKNKENRTVLFIAIIVVLVLIWIELAVGIFGTPFAGS